MYLMMVLEVGKMFKCYFNVVNLDDVVVCYGVDCFCMFEMFLGLIEQVKFWNMISISGISCFLNNFWCLFYCDGKWLVIDEEVIKDEMKVLYIVIKKVMEDVECFVFNICVSVFMVVINDLNKMKCYKCVVLELFLILMVFFVVYLSEELWENMGYDISVYYVVWFVWDEKWLVEDSVIYLIVINGKICVMVDFLVDVLKVDFEVVVLDIVEVQKYLEGKIICKIIVVFG